MNIGYCRVSKSDGSQKFDLQIDALKKEGVDEDYIFFDKASGSKTVRPGLANCLRTLREGDKLVVWSLDRLGRNLRHLINVIHDLEEKGVSFKILGGHGQGIDTSTAQGRLVFQIFASLAEFEREMIRERTKAGIMAARARGRNGGRKYKLTKAKIRLAEAAMRNHDTIVPELCKELGITKATLYRYIGPDGELREPARKVLEL